MSSTVLDFIAADRSNVAAEAVRAFLNDDCRMRLVAGVRLCKGVVICVAATIVLNDVANLRRVVLHILAAENAGAVCEILDCREYKL